MRSFAFNTVKKIANEVKKKIVKLVVKLHLKVTALGPDFACTCKHVHTTMLL